jgi:hypothetical protein
MRDPVPNFLDIVNVADARDGDVVDLVLNGKGDVNLVFFRDGGKVLDGFQWKVDALF